MLTRTIALWARYLYKSYCILGKRTVPHFMTSTSVRVVDFTGLLGGYDSPEPWTAVRTGHELCKILPTFALNLPLTTPNGVGLGKITLSTSKNFA